MPHTIFVLSACVCVRRTESGVSVDSLTPPLSSHLMAVDNFNYESSDTEYDRISTDTGDIVVTRKVCLFFSMKVWQSARLQVHLFSANSSSTVKVKVEDI